MFNELWDGLKKATNTQMEKYKDSGVIRVLEKTVDTFEALIKTMDIFLKSHGVDVKETYDKGKIKLKGAFDKLIDAGKLVKEKGVKASVEEAISVIKSKYKAFTDTVRGPPTEIIAEKLNRIKGFLVDKLGKPEEELDADGNPKQKGFLGRTKDFLRNKLTDEKKETEEDKDTDKDEKPGTVRSTLTKGRDWIKDKYDRMARRREEVEEEKRKVRESKEKEKDKKPGWLSFLVGKIWDGVKFLGSAIGGVVTALAATGKLILGGITYVGGKLLAALGLTKAAGGVAAAAAGAGKAIAGGIAAVGRGALTALTTVGKGAIAGAKIAGTAAVGAAKVAGTVLSAKVVVPVLAVAAVAYGGYRIYRHMTRGSARNNIFGNLTRLRLLMYGYNDLNRQYYNRIFDLEMLMKDFVTFQNNRADIRQFDQPTINKILSLFNITRDETEKVDILNNWLARRFLPAFRAFMQALYSVNTAIYVDNINNLRLADVYDLLTRLQIPTSIYDITQAPTFASPTILVTKADVDNHFNSLITELRAQRATEPDTPTTPPTSQSTAPVNNQRPPDPPAPKPAPVPERTLPPDAEGEPPPPRVQAHGNDMDQTSAKVSGRLNIAPGNLMPGGLDMTGIQLHNIDRSHITNLDPNMRELFTGMAREYHSLTGKNLPVTEGFRTYERQAELHRKMPDRAARPGNSMHEFGLAVDVNTAHVRELEELGLLRKYGFTAAIGGEGWHIEPIGVSLNPQLARRDPNFRADAIAASPGKGGSGYGFRSDSRMKRRNIPYQTEIFNSGSDNPIDINKVRENTRGPIPPTRENETNINNVVPPIAPPVQTQRPTTPERTLPPDAEGEPPPPRVTQPTQPNPTNTDINRNTPPLTNNLNVSGGVGTNTDLARTGNLTPPEAIAQAAAVTGVDQDMLTTIAKMESSLNPNARARTSSAAGLFQIVDGTWNELTRTHGSRYGITRESDRLDPYYNSLMGAEYVRSNLRRLPEYASLGIDDTTASYLAHFLGAGGARTFISRFRQNPDAPVSSMVSPAAYRANAASMGGRTGRQFLNGLKNRINIARNKPIQAFEVNWRSGRAGPTRERANQMLEGPATSPARVGPTRTAAAALPATTAPVNNTTATPTRTPTQANTAVTIAPTPTPPPPTSTARQNSTEVFNKDVTGILNEQLTTLVTISSLLKTMNSNLDMSKLGETISNSLKTHLGSTPPSTQPTPSRPNTPFNPEMPNTTVDMKRRV